MVRRASFQNTEVDDRPYVDLYWLPLGAGSGIVRFSGWVFERLSAHRHGRPPRALYHSALQVHADGQTSVIEMTPALERPKERGVVSTGPVGSRWPPRSRAYCYEVRRWESGTIGDVDAAVMSPQRLSSNVGMADELLRLAEEFPAFTWGRDEQHAGDMWNSNSLTAWLLARSGHDMTTIAPPQRGRAPGWSAGLEVAGRDSARVGGIPC